MTAPITDRAASWRFDPTFPNPAGGPVRGNLHLPTSSRVEIDILDAGGPRVKSLLAGRFPAGDLPFSWNGRDANGTALPSGAYFVRSRGEGGADSRRVLVLH